MQETFEIEKITFKRKETDRGIILGRRPWKWTLGRKYSPCHAKDLTQKCNISTLSPHKSNFFVYIPAAALEIGQVIRIVNKEYQKELIEKTVKIITVTPQYIETESVEIAPAPPKKKRSQAVSARKQKQEPEQEYEQEHDWNLRDLHCTGYLADPEEASDNYVITESQVMEEDFQNDEEPDETINHHNTGAFIMNKRQHAFTFISTTAPKQQEILTLTAPEQTETKPPKIDRMQYSMFVPRYERRSHETTLDNLPIFQRQEETPIDNSPLQPTAFFRSHYPTDRGALEKKEQQILQELRTAKLTDDARTGLRQNLWVIRHLLAEMPKETVAGFSSDEVAILTALLAGQPKHIDQIYAETRMPIGLISATLLMLEMKNRVTQQAGKMFLKK